MRSAYLSTLPKRISKNDIQFIKGYTRRTTKSRNNKCSQSTPSWFIGNTTTW